MSFRLFIGVPLPAATQDALKAHLDPFAPLPGRAVPLQNLHFTLRFLGETSRSDADAINEQLSETALGESFDATLGALGAFPRASSARVLWVGVERGASELTSLAYAVEMAVRAAGAPAEQRPFTPHLTLSRLRPPADIAATLEEIPAAQVPFVVDSVVVFRSHLGSGPPRYEPLRSYGLN